MADLCAQWIAEVFSGKFTLPSDEVMEKEAEQVVKLQGLDWDNQGRGNPPDSDAKLVDYFGKVMGRERPTPEQVWDELENGSEERKRLLRRWLKAPRHRPWLRPEDSTDQYEETWVPKYEAKL